MKKPTTFEELIVQAIADDKELHSLLRQKAIDAINTIDISELIQGVLSDTIDVIFEDNALYQSIEEDIKEGCTAALAEYFRGKRER